MENYGSKIKKYRVNNGLTQNDLANLLHVTPQAVSKWENNQSEPDLATFRKLSEVLDVSIDDFFGNEKIMTNNQDLGICSVCHKPYGSNGLREIDNEIVCVDCLRKRELKIKQEEGKVLAKEKEKEKIRLDRKKLSIRLIIGLIIGTIITAFFVVSILTTELKPDESFAELVITAIVMGLMSLTFITQMLYDSWLRNTFSNYVGKSFRMPGVIFNLSISGVVWLILVKLLFKLIGFILSVIVFIFGLIITFLISPITYVIDLILGEKICYEKNTRNYYIINIKFHTY